MTWNHGAVRRYFERMTSAPNHVVEHGQFPVEGGVIHCYLLEGPFDSRWDNDLSHRAKRSVRGARWVVLIVENIPNGEAGVSLCGNESEAREIFDGFANLMTS